MEERCREDGLKTWNNYSILKINKICGINWKTLKCIWDSISDRGTNRDVSEWFRNYCGLFCEEKEEELIEAKH